MANIGNLLRCYELYSTAYHSSEDTQDLLFESYKNIIVFWQKAAGLLGRKSKSQRQFSSGCFVLGKLHSHLIRPEIITLN